MLFTIQESIKAVKDYLCSGKSLEDFEIEHGIRGKSDGNHILLDYNQFSVKWTEPYGYVCRGLVLDAKTYNVLGLGLAKFFNQDEGYAAKIDWNSARVVEKLDGSMFNRWYSPHTGRFEYTTRFQLPHELDQNRVGGFDLTWRQLLEQAIANSKHQNHFGESHTVVYEVMSLYNQIVVRHEKPKLVMLAARDLISMKEEDIFIERLKGHIPTTYEIKSPEELKKYVESLHGSKSEGCIVVDGNNNRQKWKSPSYVHMHHLKDSAQNIKSLLLLSKNGEKDEVVAYFPEYLKLFNGIESIVGEFINRHEMVYNEYKALESQKDFAIAIQKSGLEATSLLFNVRAKRSPTIKDALFSVDDVQFVKLLKPLVEKSGIVESQFLLEDEVREAA